MTNKAGLLVAVALALLVGAAAGVFLFAPHPLVRRLTKVQPTPSKIESAFQAVAQAPDQADRWAQAADVLRSEGRLPGAEAAFRAARSLAPQDASLQEQLGYTLLERGRELEAWAQLEEAKARGVQSAMLDFTLDNLGARIETSGAFPRFVVPKDAPKKAAPPKVALRNTPPPSADLRSEGAGGDEPEAQSPSVAPPPRAPEPESIEPEEEEPEQEPAAVPEAAPESRASTPAPLGPCEIRAAPVRGRGTYLVDVVIDGVPTQLILDTGATLTVISSAFADEANIRADPGREIGARTAGGFVRFETAVVSSVDVGGRSVENVRVAICDECTAELASGLLGLDVQRPLGLALDVRRQVVRFADCE